LSESELDALTQELGGILDYAAEVAALDTKDVPPTAHPVPLVNVLRADKARRGVDRDEVLGQAPAAEDGRFRVPRILGEAPRPRGPPPPRFAAGHGRPAPWER